MSSEPKQGSVRLVSIANVPNSLELSEKMFYPNPHFFNLQVIQPSSGGRLTMNVCQMASALGISRAKAYQLANNKDFKPTLKLGKRIVIVVSAFNKWIEEQTA